MLPRLIQLHVFISLQISTTVFLIGQIQYADLSNQYLENNRKFLKQGFRFQWTIDGEYPQSEEVYADASRAYRRIAEQIDANQQGRRQHFEMMAKTFDSPGAISGQPASGGRAPPEFLAGQYGLYSSPRGTRLRVAARWKNEPPWEDNGWENFPLDGGPMRVLTYFNDELFYTFASSNIDPKGQPVRAFHVRHISQKELPESIPGTIRLNSGSLKVDQYDELLFESSPSEGRKLAKYKITPLEDGVVAVEITDQPLNELSYAPGIKQGFKIYAEIETRKGGLPRLIKSTQMFDYLGKILNAKAEASEWEREIHFENVEIPGLGFYAKKIIHISYRWFPTEAEIPQMLSEERSNYFYEYNRVRDPSQIFPFFIGKMSVEMAETWDWQNPDRQFSKEEKAAHIFVDEQSGISEMHFDKITRNRTSDKIATNEDSEKSIDEFEGASNGGLELMNETNLFAIQNNSESAVAQSTWLLVWLGLIGFVVVFYLLLRMRRTNS